MNDVFCYLLFGMIIFLGVFVFRVDVDVDVYLHSSLRAELRIIRNRYMKMKTSGTERLVRSLARTSTNKKKTRSGFTLTIC